MPTGDLAIILGRAEGTDGLQMLRRRAEGSPVEFGQIRPLQEGKPIDGEVLSLRQRADVPFVYDVKTELPDPRPEAQQLAATDAARLAGGGPAQIATDSYRAGWDAIWGHATIDKKSLN